MLSGLVNHLKDVSRKWLGASATALSDSCELVLGKTDIFMSAGDLHVTAVNWSLGGGRKWRVWIRLLLRSIRVGKGEEISYNESEEANFKKSSDRKGGRKGYGGIISSELRKEGSGRRRSRKIVQVGGGHGSENRLETGSRKKEGREAWIRRLMTLQMKQKLSR